MKHLFTRYSWRERYQFLGVGAIVLLVACYQFAIKPTLRMRHVYRHQQEMEIKRQRMLKELGLLHSLGIAHKSTNSREEIVSQYSQLSEPERIAQYAENCGVQVRNLPVSEKINVETLAVEYAQYQLEGGFLELVRLLNDIEVEGGVLITNVYFVSQHHPVTRQPLLQMQLGTARFDKNL